MTRCMIVNKNNDISALMVPSRDKTNFGPFDMYESCFLPFLSVGNKVGRSYCMSIPMRPITCPPPICTLTCKMLRDKLLALEDLSLPTSEKNLVSYRIVKKTLTKTSFTV